MTLILQGVPLLGGVKQGWDGKTSYFRAKCANISKTVRNTFIVTINESHMCFQLAPRSMTLDDLELLKVRIFGKFRRFGRQQQLNDWMARCWSLRM